MNIRRYFRELIYDLKEPGINIWMIPIIIAFFLIMTAALQRGLRSIGRENLFTLPILEIILPALGGYAAIMLMQGILDTEGGEILFSYPRSRLYWGFIRQFRFFFLFLLVAAVTCELVSLIMSINFFQLFIQSAAQCYSVMAVSFLGIIIGRKVSIGIVFMVAFIGIQITLGREFDVFNWIYILDGYDNNHLKQGMIITNSFIIGTFGWLVGQIWLRP